MNFYNEFDPAAAAWLRGLIAERLIPAGVVDERSIADIEPDELHGFAQCHFFAGIGGWSLALELAGVDSTRPLWTGSCPCQPYSDAGKGLGDADPRNLWPAFFRLIRECRPELVFGEQVAAAIGKGWLDRVSADLEGEGYACGAAVLGAHSVSSPHIRKRLYWVADASGSGHEGRTAGPESRGFADAEGGGSRRRLADSLSPGLQGHAGHGDGGNEPGRLDPHAAGPVAAGGSVGGMADPELDDRRADQPERGPEGRAADRRACGGAESGGMGDASRRGLGIVGDAARPGSGGHADGAGGASCGMAYPDGRDASAEREQRGGEQRREPGDSGGGFWSDSYWLLCRDGKHRRVPTEPALFPLADGLPYKLARRGSIRPALLKGAGNAIVPETAAEFISAFLEATKR